MSDAELICAKSRIIVSKQAIEKNQFELLNRQSMEKIFFNSINELLNHI